MPSIRKLAPEEVEAVLSTKKEQGPRQRVAEEYDRYLNQFDLSEYAEVELGEEESRLTVANRFKAAAQRRGVSLRFMRMKGNIMRFQVLPGESAEQTTEPAQNNESSVGSDTPPTNRKGRPRKT